MSLLEMDHNCCGFFLVCCCCCFSRMLNVMAAVAMCLFWTKLHPGQSDIASHSPTNQFPWLLTVSKNCDFSQHPDETVTSSEQGETEDPITTLTAASLIFQHTAIPAGYMMKQTLSLLCFLICILSPHTHWSKASRRYTKLFQWIN